MTRSQLPMAEVAHSTRPPEPPNLFKRLSWAFDAISSHDLTILQGAVLVRLSFRAASGEVWETQERIAAAVGAKRRAAVGALKALASLGLVRVRSRFGASNVYQPLWGVCTKCTIGSGEVCTVCAGGVQETPAGGVQDMHPLTIKKKREEGKEELEALTPQFPLQGDEVSEMWDRALDELRSQVPGPSFETWLSGVRAAALDDGVLVLLVESEFVADMLERSMRPMIGDAVESTMGRRPSDVRFMVATAERAEAAA